MGARYVTANGLRFAFLTQGPTDGPLAVCLHGFPDHARTWRHLLPRLAEAGYHAVAPWLRGYAPSEVPEDLLTRPDDLAADTNALHRGLAGDERAVLIGHDWGAIAAYRAAAAAPRRWARVVAMAVPPEPALAAVRPTLRQLRRSWYTLLFQLPRAARVVERDDFELVDRLWAAWSPGYEREPSDRGPLLATLRSPGTLEAALGYYRGVGREVLRGAFPADAAISVPPQETLYLHGADDGCLPADLATGAGAHLAAGSRAEVVSDAGHFLHLERPEAVADHVLGFVGAAARPA